MFGGFYETASNYYIVSGQRNKNENDSVEVIRITKYDKNWNAVSRTGVFGGNTIEPFRSGSCRFAECGDYLLIRSSHTMYADYRGTNHQSNLTIQLDTRTMTISDNSAYFEAGGYGHVSHSFNQFIGVDNNKVVAVDHGDAYPRAMALTKYTNDCSKGKFSGGTTTYDLVELDGSSGQNYTGGSLGGFEISDTSYLVVGNKDINFNIYGTGTRNIFLSVINRSTSAVETKWLTNYPEGHDTATTPYLIKVKSNKYMVMWSEGDNVCYLYIDGNGNVLTQMMSFAGNLSNCKPLCANGRVVWYVCEYDRGIASTDFYELALDRDDGLYFSDDGNVYLYQNGSIASYYNGLYNDANLGCWLVLNGRVAFEYNDLYCDTVYGWCKIAAGTIDYGYNDLYCSPTMGWWKIANGVIDFTYNDLYCSPTMGWWKISFGQIDFAYTDLYCSPTMGWWKINGGMLDSTYNDIYCSPVFGWYKIANGAVDFNYCDMYNSPTMGWWKIAYGALDLNYNDVYFSNLLNGYLKIAGGTVDWYYTDLYLSSFGWWKVKNGILDLDYNGLYCSPVMGWWLVTWGGINFGYDGVYNDAAVGSWFCQNGTINTTYTGRVITNGIAYDVVNGYATPASLRVEKAEETEEVADTVTEN